MDSAELLPASASTPPAPQFHIAPRQRTLDDDAPPFFVRFADDGHTLELLTPTTRESYAAATLPEPGAC